MKIPHMKKLYFLVTALCFFNGLSAQVINFPDLYFKYRLTAYGGFSKDKDGLTINNIDLNHDGKIQENEALNVYYLDIPLTDRYRDQVIKDLTGIEYFKNLRGLNCGGQNISTLDVSMLKELKELNASCYLKSINVSGLTNLEILKVSAVSTQYGGSAGMASLDLSTTLNLKDLFVTGTDLTSLDLSHLTKLENAKITYNWKLSSLNFNKLTQLKSVDCSDNALENINVLGGTNLESLICNSNKLTFLDLSGLTNLKTIECLINKITSLDVSGMKYLIKLNCRDNELTSLNLNNTMLYELDFSGNKLKSITLPNVPKGSFYGFNNLLETIDLKNGVKDLMEGIYFNLGNVSTLKYICADDMDWYQMQELRVRNRYKFEYNSYCSFVPGGEVYLLKGNQKFDSDNNGCDASDIVFPELKFDITNGKTAGNFISSVNGNYSIAVGQGTHKITPKIENPNYFTISPEAYSVSFPDKTSPYVQDFCITPNGIHRDLEVVVLPLNVVRPGFEAYYKIVYKNKGNVKQSGTVRFKFDNSILKYISSNTAIATKSVNTIEWNFTNLQPFETREIRLTLEANRPTDTPPVNTGDILHYTTTNDTPDADEMPADNVFVLNQTVLGSFDPNDKTCLEGDVITPALIGEYVHYMIRFENTGTYYAENIVVKDMIDLSKFDISTLIPTSSSHSFVTKISEGNKVEFIFENIKLPFDDANNDGYIAFKIKTKPTLRVGDTFTNEANIYFDYNFPILTNKATSKFERTLGTSDFEFLNYFTLYPNPVNDILNINAKQDIEIQSLAIYDVLGQLVIAVPNAKLVSNIDISKLRTGNYFIKIKSDKGSSNIKFIKK
nr:T9SS type A sorting domain-containing protein [Flavobacterium sp. ASV13]